MVQFPGILEDAIYKEMNTYMSLRTTVYIRERERERVNK